MWLMAIFCRWPINIQHGGENTALLCYLLLLIGTETLSKASKLNNTLLFSKRY